jgi:hypothetical protein
MIEVRAHHTLEELGPAAMDELNLASSRASLFGAPQWLRHFIEHDVTFKSSGARPYFLAAWEGAKLKGFFALKATEDRLGRSLSSLITLEVERPRVVAAREDELRVTHAFFRYLLHRADEWDVLELVQQDAASPLYAGPPELGPRHWLRRMPDRPNNVLALPFADGAGYVASLSKNMRHSTRKQLKGLLSEPGLTLLTADTPAGRAALFEVFLEIEQRSWKPRVGATVGAREQTYRAALADPTLHPVACIASLDGLPIAGSVWIHYGAQTYHLQTVYSEAHEALSPGTLMSWVPIADAIARRQVSFDMLPDFSHYKSRWGAKSIDTELVQLFRVGSARHLKAVAGDFWRRVKPRDATGAPAGKNPYKVAAGEAKGPPTIDRPRLDALLATARAAGAVEASVAKLGENPFL